MIRNVDGHDPEEIKTAIDTARKSAQPTLICCKTTIGFGSPNKQGKEDCHGAPLGDAEIALTRAALKWNHGPFEIPADIYAEWDAKEAGRAAEAEWDQRFAAYSADFPSWPIELVASPQRRTAGRLQRKGRCLHRRSRRQGRNHRQPQGQPERPERLRPAAA